MDLKTDKVIDIVVRVLYEGEDPEVPVTAEASLSGLGADSLDLVEIIMEIEEEFGVHISDAAAEEVRLVGDLIKLA